MTPSIDWGRALAWAEAILGTKLGHPVALPGGITSTMLAFPDATGAEFVLRLMTNEPWRAAGPALTRRERKALRSLDGSGVPVPTSVAVDPAGRAAGVSAHLMTRVPGVPTVDLDADAISAMAVMLCAVHGHRAAVPFRRFQSWAPRTKWVVPSWSRLPDAWTRGFAVLAAPPLAYGPVFMHRDFSHRNVLWADGVISGVVDWVEASMGPAWLDAGHAASNLAMAFGVDPAAHFVAAFSELTRRPVEPYWLILDAVGFLAVPGDTPVFGSAEELMRLDDWLHRVVDSYLP